jgi:hypothetical protein
MEQYEAEFNEAVEEIKREIETGASLEEGQG